VDEKIAIVAPGAIGGPIAALLTRSGYNVVLVEQWPDHVEAMRRDGLRVTIGPREEPEDEFTVDVRAVHVHEACTLRETFDIVLVTCKSYDTRWLVQLIEPKLAGDGVVVSIQNSLNYEWIAPIVGQARTISCLLTGGGELLEPGHAWRNRRLDHHYYTLGELDGSKTARLDRIAAILGDAGSTGITTNVKAALWTKLVHNSVSAALSGLVAGKRRSWQLIEMPEFRAVSAQLFREGVDVAIAHDQQLEPLYDVPTAQLRNASDDAIAELLSATGGGASKGATSMVQQDLARGRPTEVVDYFSGLLIRKGREFGLPTPMNERMVELYRRLEAGELAPGEENLALFADCTGLGADQQHTGN